MKNLFLILSVLILSGCATPVPVVPKFPDVPKELLVECPYLKEVEPTTKKLSDVLDTVTDNYQQYYECKAKVDDWAEWYKTQKQIFNSIK